MRGMNLDRLLTFGADLSAQNAPAWKYERMKLASVDHGELKVPANGAVEIGCQSIMAVNDRSLPAGLI